MFYDLAESTTAETVVPFSMLPPECNPAYSDSDEESFVVLEHETNTFENEYLSNEIIQESLKEISDLKSSILAAPEEKCSSIKSDLSIDEIHNKVASLLTENIQLKGVK